VFLALLALEIPQRYTSLESNSPTLHSWQAQQNRPECSSREDKWGLRKQILDSLRNPLAEAMTMLNTLENHKRKRSRKLVNERSKNLLIKDIPHLIFIKAFSSLTGDVLSLHAWILAQFTLNLNFVSLGILFSFGQHVPKKVSWKFQQNKRIYSHVFSFN